MEEEFKQELRSLIRKYDYSLDISNIDEEVLADYIIANLKAIYNMNKINDELNSYRLED